MHKVYFLMLFPALVPYTRFRIMLSFTGVCGVFSAGISLSTFAWQFGPGYLCQCVLFVEVLLILSCSTFILDVSVSVFIYLELLWFILTVM